VFLFLRKFNLQAHQTFTHIVHAECKDIRSSTKGKPNPHQEMANNITRKKYNYKQKFAATIVHT